MGGRRGVTALTAAALAVVATAASAPAGRADAGEGAGEPLSIAAGLLGDALGGADETVAAAMTAVSGDAATSVAPLLSPAPAATPAVADRPLLAADSPATTSPADAASTPGADGLQVSADAASALATVLVRLPAAPGYGGPGAVDVVVSGVVRYQAGSTRYRGGTAAAGNPSGATVQAPSTPPDRPAPDALEALPGAQPARYQSIGIRYQAGDTTIQATIENRMYVTVGGMPPEIATEMQTDLTESGEQFDDLAGGGCEAGCAGQEAVAAPNASSAPQPLTGGAEATAGTGRPRLPDDPPQTGLTPRTRGEPAARAACCGADGVPHADPGAAHDAERPARLVSEGLPEPAKALQRAARPARDALPRRSGRASLPEDPGPSEVPAPGGGALAQAASAAAGTAGLVAAGPGSPFVRRPPPGAVREVAPDLAPSDRPHSVPERPG